MRQVSSGIVSLAYFPVNARERPKCRAVAQVCKDDAIRASTGEDAIADRLSRGAQLQTLPQTSARAAAVYRARTLAPIGLCLVAALLALGLGRLVVRAWPVPVEIIGGGPILEISVDGVSRRVDLSAPLIAIRPAAPITYRREHQVDGSDSTNMFTFAPRYFAQFADSPYYQFQAWLREEWRYSRWTDLEVIDGSGRVLLAQADPPDEINVPVPPSFRVRVALERPEIPRTLELIDAEQNVLHLELNRNDKYVRLGRGSQLDRADLLRWYFPRDPLPPLATLLDLVARAIALAFATVLVVGLVAAALPAPVRWTPGSRSLAVTLGAGLIWFLLASWYVGTALFDRSPHILDAISYLFQAKTFAGGALWAPPPLVNDAFSIPFATLYQERWFSQYPPATGATLALGIWAGAPWLAHPLLAAASVALVALAVRRQYGPGTALLVAALLVTSPFLLLTAGSFLSHIPALFCCAVAMYAITRYADQPSAGWAALTGLGLALALLTREIVPILFGASIVLTGLVQAADRRGRRLLLDALALGAVFAVGVAAYGAYNWAVTGHPLLLPRLLFNSADLWGFGPGIGFYGEHTIASGLVITEQQLVSLGFYAAGWPFGFTLALALLPLLLRRVSPWDAAHGSLVLFFVVAYSAYFYHGIAFGPRYYFEALPSVLILAVRGFGAMTETLTVWLLSFGYRQPWWRARQSASILFAALVACNLLYFLPRQTVLYANYTGLPGGGPILGEEIGRDLSGRVPLLDNALVAVDEWWYFTLYFTAMNCPRLDCPVIFAHSGDDETRTLLHRMYPARNWHTVIDRRGVLTIVPASPPSSP